MLWYCTIIRFVTTSAKFGISTVVGLNGHLLKIKCVYSRVNVKILSSTSVSYRPTTVQVPSLALTRHETDNSLLANKSCPWQNQSIFLVIFAGKPGISAGSARAQQGGQTQVQQNQTKVDKTLVNFIVCHLICQLLALCRICCLQLYFLREAGISVRFQLSEEA
jgi:hypothetical protein